jgi:predicted small secreted protein
VKRILTSAVLIGGLVLGGCQTTRYATVPCVGKDQSLPAEPPKIADKLTGKADEDVKIIAGSNVRLRSWGRGLHLILEGCRG